tara:strand:+ start:348 stop:659 length:312 start_codon:yes stop_codon:yes gene_type:complete
MNRYRFTKIKKDSDGFQHRVVTEYPIITPKNSDRIYFSKQGERFDNIAYKFYEDTSLWWVIARANTDLEFKGNMALPTGTKLSIPTDVGEVLADLERINRIRQ